MKTLRELFTHPENGGIICGKHTHVKKVLEEYGDWVLCPPAAPEAPMPKPEAEDEWTRNLLDACAEHTKRIRALEPEPKPEALEELDEHSDCVDGFGDEMKTHDRLLLKACAEQTAKQIAEAINPYRKERK